MRQLQATAWEVPPLPFSGVLADALARSLDGPVGSCCGGSGVRPLLPSPSEVADAPRDSVRPGSCRSASVWEKLLLTQLSYQQARFDVVANKMKCMLIKVGWKKDFVEKNTPAMPISGWMGVNLLKKSVNMGLVELGLIPTRR